MRRSILWVALWAAACGEAPDQAWEAIVRDSAGVLVVELPGRGPEAPIRALGLDPSWGPGPELELGHLVDLAVAGDGRVALLDDQPARVLVLDRAGKLEATFAGPGAGPGELDPRGLMSLMATDSSVQVPDLAQGRVSEFSLEGSLLREDRMFAEAGMPVEWRSHPLGGVAVRTMGMDAPDLLLRIQDGRVDTLHVFPRVQVPHNTLLPPTVLWDLTPEGRLATARSDGGEVEVLEPGAGEPLRLVRLPWEPGPLTDAEGRALEDLVVGSEEIGAGGVRLTPEGREALLARVRLPDRRPVLAGILAAPDGSLWFGRSRPIPEMGREALRVGSSRGWMGRDWFVMAPDGRSVETVRLPEGFTPRAFLGSFLYGIQEDEMGVQRPARIRAPADGRR